MVEQEKRGILTSGEAGLSTLTVIAGGIALNSPDQTVFKVGVALAIAGGLGGPLINYARFGPDSRRGDATKETQRLEE